MITVEPVVQANNSAKPSANTAPAVQADEKHVFSTFGGVVDVVDVLVKVGDNVSKGQAVVQVEAMKAKHDIKSPEEGTVTAVFVQIGDEVDSSKPLISLA